MCLYGLGALRGLCGFCARVELGGLEACGVFVLVFFFFALLLCSLPGLLSLYPCVCLLLMLFAFACPLVLSLWLFVFVVVVSFSLSDYTDKKKGRKGFAPCVLLCPVVGCFIWLLLCTPRTRQVSDRLCRNKVL